MRIARVLCLLACAAGLGQAAAHDSWLAPGARGELVFRTGSHYPLADSSPSAKSVLQAGCSDQGGRPIALRAVEKDVLRLEGVPAGGASCWAELAAHSIDLAPALVDVYLKEIRPPQALRDRWAAMKADGLPWRESYRKFARIELAGAGAGSAARAVAARAPRGLPLEIVVEGDAALRAMQPASFRVLSDGEPVVGLSVQLVSERSPLGVWSQSDALGRVRYVLPFAGQWLVRATLLEPQGDGWQSRFVTLTFDAAP